MHRVCLTHLRAVIALGVASSASAQTRLDHADPTIVERSLPKAADRRPHADAELPTPAVSITTPPSAEPPIVASSIVVDGGSVIPRSAFGDAIAPFLRRDLSTGDIAKVASAIANAARNAGMPFASAWIEPQAIADGVLRVTLDAGTLAAVRVIGAINPYADRLLTKALVTGNPVRQRDLERAILLVGDIPGVTVESCKYIRQDGFGILLVTIKQDRVSAYAQLDNRGSKELGPVRSTLLANVRGVVKAGDELGLIVAQTPLRPSEFLFVRGRYSIPVNADGAVVSVSGSYGATHPGGSLHALNVAGESFDVAISYANPLLRRRGTSLWGNVELRGVGIDETLLDSPLRKDRLATLTTSLNGNTKLGRGVLRGDVAVAAGLPIPGVTHQGDGGSSRSDGDARYATVSYDLDFTMPVNERVSILIASQAQVASRPLLATAEIGIGGPTFGRAYDYAERSGDNGILGSSEVRYDFGTVAPHIFDRLQLYGSVDGGYVTNLRGGYGGGGLLSTALGIRLGRGLFDGMLEVAMPLNSDRFNSYGQSPRISSRISRVF